MLKVTQDISFIINSQFDWNVFKRDRTATEFDFAFQIASFNPSFEIPINIVRFILSITLQFRTKFNHLQRSKFVTSFICDMLRIILFRFGNLKVTECRTYADMFEFERFIFFFLQEIVAFNFRWQRSKKLKAHMPINL